MVNGKMPLYLTALGVAGLGLGGLLWQPYTADWPATTYAKPIRRYIHAAIRQDSTDLARISASAEAVSWGLTIGRAHGASLAQWERRMQVWAGERRGDTAQVFVYPDGNECESAPIVLQLVGRDGAARVLRASSTCWLR